MFDPRIAKLKAALDASVIDEETYRAALAALSAPGGGATVGGATVGGASVGGNVDAGRDFVGRDQITITSNRYAGPDPTGEPEKRRIYLRYLVQTLSTLPLGAFDPAEAGAGDESSGMQLDNVFIGLETTTQVKNKGLRVDGIVLDVPSHEAVQSQTIGGDFEPGGREESRALRVIEALSANTQIVITGEPGSGKSTVTNYVLLAHAQQRLGAGADLIKPFTEDWHAKLGLAPLRVILRDFEVWLAKHDGESGSALLWDFIAHTLREQNLEFAASWLKDELEKHEALLVLDGLDEISTNAMRLRVRQAVEAFATRYAGNRFVVTCRTLSYQEPDFGQPELRLSARAFPAFQIAELTDAMIADFIEAWHRELRREGKIKNGETQMRLQEALGTALQQDDLRRLARNPLQLTLMAWVHTDSDELPDKRAKLYDRAIDLLLWKWETKKQYRAAHATLGELAQQAPNGRDEIVRALGRAAYDAHAALTDPARDALAAVDEMALLRNLARLKPDPVSGKGDMSWASEVIDGLKTRSGLLARSGENKLTFPHRTFQEYLAGVHMLEDGDFVGLALERSRDLTLWREPILLATGYNVYVQKRRDLALPLTLARRLCDVFTVDDDLRWKRAWLAGEVLREIGTEDVKAKEPSTYILVQEKLTTLVTDGQLRPVERARAGLVLARLGDPRFDPGRWHLPVRNEPLLGFVDIPAGEVFMGTAADVFYQQMELLGVDKSRADKYYTDEKNPAQSSNAIKRFLLARYPTTVAQFRAFVIATGRNKESAAIALSEPATAPVRYVTGHDAMAYCAWLNEQLKQAPDTPEALRALLVDGGYRVTLPSEAEWERAARSDTPTRPLFPWGDAMPGRDADDFANITYADINTTCIVGAFPHGRSPFGVQDMVGNVWEWTRSNFDRPDSDKKDKRLRFDYPYDPSDGREDVSAPDSWQRVVRGGAFLANQDDARVAYRLRSFPNDSFNDLGFRVSVSPTSL